MRWNISFLLVVLALVAGHAVGKSSLIPANGKLSPAKSRREGKVGDVSLSAVVPVSAVVAGDISAPVSSVDWRFFLAGGLCAAFSHGLTTPIDVVKTRMQQEPEKYTRGMLSATGDIVAENGVGFLLAGLGPTVVGYGLEGALKFGCYESCKPFFAGVFKKELHNFLLASVAAGAVASMVLCPMEETRIKMVGDATWKGESLLSGLFRITAETGLLATFGVFPAMLSKQIPYTAGKQVSFDIIAKTLHHGFAQMKWSQGKNLTFLVSVMSAFFASIAACMCSQPGDMMLTASYKVGGDSHSVSSFFSIARSIFEEHGLGGFFLGLQARLAHVGFIITSQLVVYDIIKKALGLPATGSH